MWLQCGYEACCPLTLLLDGNARFSFHLSLGKGRGYTTNALWEAHLVNQGVTMECPPGFCCSRALSWEPESS
jgi:hypothetical protein